MQLNSQKLGQKVLRLVLRFVLNLWCRHLERLIDAKEFDPEISTKLDTINYLLER